MHVNCAIRGQFLPVLIVFDLYGLNLPVVVDTRDGDRGARALPELRASRSDLQINVKLAAFARIHDFKIEDFSRFRNDRLDLGYSYWRGNGSHCLVAKPEPTVGQFDESDFATGNTCDPTSWAA
jgi:hypothetical protein